MSITKGRAVTISDVAQAAGVSRAAVSKVIRNAYGVSPGMRERVEAAIEELGYRPSMAARALRGSSYRLGLEIPYLSAFMTQILEGAERAIAGTPYKLVLAPAENIEYPTIESLADGIVDGIVAVSPLVEPTWLEELSGRVPVVMLGRHDQTEGYDTVVSDDHAGARAVMEHLLTLGHRRIAHLTETVVNTKEGSGTPHSIRLEVYRRCMAEAGLGDLIEILHRPKTTAAEAQACADRLLALPEPPTAIFAGHDDIAIEVLARVEAAGLRGRVAVVGYDNTSFAAHPLIDLTSVDQQGVEMGAQATTMLLERLQGRTEPRSWKAGVELRVRSSSAGVPAPHGRTY